MLQSQESDRNLFVRIFSNELLDVTHLDEHPVTWREVEVVRPLNDETRDVRGKHDARGDDTLTSAVGKPGEDPEHQLATKHSDWCKDP